MAPASKSAMQRAVAIAALADGISEISNLCWSDDAEAALRVSAVLGAKIERSKDSLLISGLGMEAIKNADKGKRLSVSCGESGLSLRMFSSIAALFPYELELKAEGSLRSRPAGMAEEPLRQLGASCYSKDGCPPLAIRGPIKPGSVKTDAGQSSQFLSGLLIALACAGGRSVVKAEKLASKGYINLTTSLMKKFGADCTCAPDCRTFELEGQGYVAANYEVEGDWSAAAFLLAAAASAGMPSGLRVGGLGRHSFQPDRAVLTALEAAGAVLNWDGLDICVKPGRLKAFSFNATDCPDLFPPLAALAASCEGTSYIDGAGRLKNKESDRAKTLEKEFAKLGIEIKTEKDVMHIRGSSIKPLPGAVLDSHGDHRIAMALAVAALGAPGPMEICGAESVNKSYPGFFKDIECLRHPA
ncbi:3-phosphoshikimate 1-carboxyvinyltransferase [Spirochaetota bacterium]